MSPAVESILLDKDILVTYGLPDRLTSGENSSQRPGSEGPARLPERGLYRQSLPPLAKLRPSPADRSLRRREPKRKSLTFSGGARGLRDIFGKSRDAEGR